MSLKSAILMMLSREEATGYDLAVEFDITTGNFWQASHQQIYRDLAALETQGLVSRRIEPQVGKPDRKIYKTTAKGVEVLKAWLVEPSPIRRTTDELMLKIAAGDLMGLEALGVEVSAHRRAHAERLAAYEAIERDHYSPSDMRAAPLNIKLLRLTLRRGIRMQAAMIAWADEALAAIADLKTAYPDA